MLLASKIAENLESKSNKEIYGNKKALFNNIIDAANQEYICIYINIYILYIIYN